MGGFFKQYAWLFDILAILICSFFMAKIVGVYLGKSLEVQRSIGVLKTTEAKTAERDLKPMSDYKIITDRNIFDSSEVPVEEAAESAEGAGGMDVPTGEAVKTNLPIKIWAVLMVGEGRDGRSSATIESGGKTDVFAVGAEPSFSPGTKLVKVEPRRIEFVNNGRLEYAELMDEAGASIFGPPAEAGPPVAALEPEEPGAPDALITKEAGGKFAIDQSEVDKALQNLDQLYTEIRAVPSFSGGKMSGMKILSVKRGSVFDKLGLRRGDVLQRINGMELDVRRGFEIFNQLKDQRSITLDLVRQGKPRSFEYEIR